jgi:hypothetical protein
VLCDVDQTWNRRCANMLKEIFNSFGPANGNEQRID